MSRRLRARQESALHPEASRPENAAGRGGGAGPLLAGAAFILLAFFSVFLLFGPPFSHPLRGRIYAAAERRFLTEAELLARMRGAAVVYLGERHDNPAHHRLQARLLRALLEAGRRPAVAFEMFTRDVGPALAALLADPGADLSKVPEIVGWDRRGWPDWAMYAPLVAIAHRAGLPVVAADLPAEQSRAVGRGGLKALPPEVARELGLGPPDPAQRAAVVEQLYASHCEMVPREGLGPLYEAWRARNRTMALSLRRAIRRGADGAVLITGAGHADRTVGVPRQLAALARGTGQFSLAFVEVHRGEDRPGAYMSRPGAHDALWFTAPHPREDPCRKFRGSLERMRRRSAAPGGEGSSD